MAPQTKVENGVTYVNTQAGWMPMQLALQLQQYQQMQQLGSLQAKPEGDSGGLFGGLQSGLEGAFKKKAKDTVLGGAESKSPLDKLSEIFGFGDAPDANAWDPSASIDIPSKIPGFDLGGSPFSFGGTSEVGLPNLEATTLETPSFDFGLGAGSELPTAATPDFSLGASAPDLSLGAEGMGLPLGAEPGMFDLSGIGSAGNVLLPAAGVLGGINLAMSQGDAPSGGARNVRGALQGAASGAAAGSYFGPWGAVIGGGVGGLGGLAGSLFGSSKGERQMTRDEWRKKMIEQGFVDQDYQGTLADGSTFDFGKDEFDFSNKEGGIDLSKPAVGRAAIWGDALAGLTGFGGGKGKEAVSAQFLKAGTSNLKDPNDIQTVKDNYKHFLSKYGITNAMDAHKAFDQASASNKASRQEWNTGTAAIDQIFNDKSGFDATGKWVG